jgi:RNA-directed DNA polymerase
MEVLGKRLVRFGLALHPDKTRLLPFLRPPVGPKSGKGPATFARSLRLRCACDCVGRDFLGFTLYWARSRKGRWGMSCKTRSASLRRFLRSVYDWYRRYRHLPVKAQHAALTRRIQGHFNYFGVSGNFRSLLLVIEQAKRSWYKWLCRRSHRKRLTWERFADLLRDVPLPVPRITVRIWGS